MSPANTQHADSRGTAAEHAPRLNRTAAIVMRAFGVPLVLIGGIATAFLTVIVRRRIYDACEGPLEVGGPSAGEAFGVLYIVLPATAICAWTLMGATYALTTWRPTRIMFAAPLISLIPCLLVMWAMLALTGVDPYDNICPAGHPDWWPSWIPL